MISRVRVPAVDAPDDDDPLILGSQHRRFIDPLACSWLRVYMSTRHTSRGLAYYRDALDHQREDQMTWQPYSEDILQQLPKICRDHPQIWRTSAPLIYFDIVELYFPSRVLRQFNFEQSVPNACDTIDKLHQVDGRGAKKNYRTLHASYIEQCRRRAKTVVSGAPFTGLLTDAYIAWYRRITRLLITPPSIRRPISHYQPATTDHILSPSIADIGSRCLQAVQTAQDLPPNKALQFTIHTLQNLALSCTETLSTSGHAHLIPSSSQSHTPSTSQTLATHSLPQRGPRGGGGRRGRFRTHRRVSPRPLVPPSTPATSTSSAQQSPSQSTPTSTTLSPPPIVFTYHRQHSTSISTQRTLQTITDGDELDFESPVDKQPRL